jgi:hypothetical protein
LLAGSPWSGYALVVPLAEYEPRGAAQFDFVYVEARWKATASVPEGFTRFIRVGIYRRSYGVGDYVLMAIFSYPMFGGPGGTATVEDIEIENPQGYQTYAECLPLP